VTVETLHGHHNELSGLRVQYYDYWIWAKRFRHLIAYLPPDSTITSHQAASQINALFPYNRPADRGEHGGGTDFLYEF